MKPKILILYTGGTLGMKQAKHGLVPSDDLEQQISLAANGSPQALAQLKQIDWQINCLSPLLDSANMQPSHWQEIASACLQASQVHDGIVIIHGTDTLAYTASALAFLLQTIAVPVIITGAQKPLSLQNSDALPNLLGALKAACTTEKGIWVSFHGGLFPGARVVKKDALHLDGFDAPRWNGRQSTVKPFTLSPQATVRDGQDIQIASVIITPGLAVKQINAIINTQPDALILSLYSVGTLPSNDIALMRAIQTAIDKNIIVCAVSQCYISHIDFSLYEVSAKLESLGVLSAADMTFEACYCKLIILFQMGYSHAEIKKLFSQSLAGERNDE